MGALKDCEAAIDAIFGQPVNTATTVGFVLGGALIVGRSRLTWVGIAAIATGIGSALFHGPMPGFAEWAHDTTLAWLLLVVAGLGRSWEGSTHVPGLLVVGALSAIPGVADPLGALLAVAAVINALSIDRSSATLAPLALLAVVAVIGRLGATGGPLCDPDSPWQPHALWHLGAATAVTWWALGRD